MAKYSLQVSEGSNEPFFSIVADQPFAGFAIGHELFIPGEQAISASPDEKLIISEIKHILSEDGPASGRLFMHSIMVRVEARPR